MPRQIPWVWLALLGLLLLAPSPAGRLVLDVVGGITLTLLLLPVLLGGIGLIAWQVLRRRLTVCPTCGLTTLGAEVCPACGTGLATGSGLPQSSQVFGRGPAESGSDPVSAGSATIDVEVVSSQAFEEDGG